MSFPRNLPHLALATILAAGMLAWAGPAYAVDGHIQGTVTGPNGPLSNEPVIALVAHQEAGTTYFDLDDQGQPVRVVGSTDGAGNFDLVVPEGSYLLRLGSNPEGTAGAGVAEYYNDTLSRDAAELITVAGGQTVTGKNAELALAGQIAGRVTNVAGAGLANIKVRAFGPEQISGGHSGFAKTAGDGTYTVRGLPAAEYRVEFDDDDGSYEDEFFTDKATLETADPIDVAAGETESGKDAVLAAEGGDCVPGAVNPSLTNMGFEAGLDGWTLGTQTEPVEVVGADAYTSPNEGSKMVRLGSPRPDSEATQPEGQNVMCQDFHVTASEERFAFNLFTYDYTGFDNFTFDVAVTDPQTGETLASYEQGAWGEGTDLKTSGWRGVKLNLSDYQSDTVRLTFRAGGTSDDLYAFWVYVDSASQSLPPAVPVTPSDVSTSTGSVSTNPSTGQVTVSMPQGDVSPVTISFPATCAGGSTPSAVSLFLDGQEFVATPAGSGEYTATIPADSVSSGVLNTQVACDGSPVVVTPIGEIVLYDPSGTVTDSSTGSPIAGAEVRLFTVPGWAPKKTPGAPGANQCETNESKAPGASWSQPAPTHLGQLVNASSPAISPNVNPFVTNNAGRYGWDVAEGCWYVTVQAAGYQTRTSRVVGVPSAVTDLNIALTRTPTPKPTPTTPPPTTAPAPPPAAVPPVTGQRAAALKKCKKKSGAKKKKCKKKAMGLPL